MLASDVHTLRAICQGDPGFRTKLLVLQQRYVDYIALYHGT